MLIYRPVLFLGVPIRYRERCRPKIENPKPVNEARSRNDVADRRGIGRFEMVMVGKQASSNGLNGDLRRALDGIRLHPTLGAALIDGAYWLQKRYPKCTKTWWEFARSAIAVLRSEDLVVLIDPSRELPVWLHDEDRTFVRGRSKLPAWMTTPSFPHERVSLCSENESAIWHDFVADLENGEIVWKKCFNRSKRQKTADPYDVENDLRQRLDGVRLHDEVGRTLIVGAQQFFDQYRGCEKTKWDFARSAVSVLQRVGLIELIDPKIEALSWLPVAVKRLARRDDVRPIWMPTSRFWWTFDLWDVVVASLERDEIVWTEKRAFPTPDDTEEDDDYLGDDDDDLEDD